MTKKQVNEINRIKIDLENAHAQLRKMNRAKRLIRHEKLAIISVWFDDSDDSFDFGEYTIDDRAFKAAINTYIRELKKDYLDRKKELRRLRVI